MCMNRGLCGLRLAKPAICVLGIGMVLATIGSASAEKLSVTQSVEIALSNNPAVRIAKEEIRKTAADIRQASAAGMPRLTLDGTYTRLDSIPGSIFSGDGLPTAVLNSRAANITLAQPLDVFGIIKMGKRMAHLGRVSAEYDYDRVKNDTVFAVKQACYNVLQAQQLVRVHEETARQLEAHQSDAQANYNAGAVAKFDVLRADAQVANERSSLISARNGLKLAKAALNSLLNRSADTPVDIEEPGVPQFVDLDLGKCIESALKSRPEVMSSDTQVELSTKMVTLAREEGKPRINLVWKMNRNFTPTFVSPLTSNWFASVTSLVSLYDGGYRRSQVDQAASDAENAKIGKKALILGISLETKRAFLGVREARERIAAAEKGLETAREGARLTEVAYKGGVAKQVEVLDAQTAQTLAETNYVASVYGYQIALAKLEQSVGGQTQLAELMESGRSSHQVASR